MKKVAYILYGLLAAAAVGLLIHEYITSGTIQSASWSRAGVMMLLIALGIFRSSRSADRKALQKKQQYRETYSAYIGSVFPEDPKSEQLFFQAVDAYALQNYAGAWKRLKKLAPLCKTNEETYAVTVFSGFCLHNLEKYEPALEQYRQALQFGNDSTIASNMGVCYEKLGLNEFSMRYYRMAIIMDPDNPLPHNNLAQQYVRSGDYAQGMVYASHALAVKPDMLPALTAMAICSHKLGRTEDYEHYREKAIAHGANGDKLTAYIQSLP